MAFGVEVNVMLSRALQRRPQILRSSTRVFSKIVTDEPFLQKHTILRLPLIFKNTFIILCTIHMECVKTISLGRFLKIRISML